MKSVHITNYYHKNSGGISTAYNELLDAANRRRRFVRLIVPGESSYTEEVGEFGRIYYVKAGYSPVFDKRYRVMLPWNSYLFNQSPIKQILRDEKPDIIEIGEKYTLSLIAGLIRKGIMNVSPRRPMLVHFSCERMDDNVRSFISGGRIAASFCRTYIRNYIIPMFDFHVTNSKYTAKELLDGVSPEPGRRVSQWFFNFCWRGFRSAKTPVNERVFVNQCGADVKTFTASRKSNEARQKILEEYDLPADAKLLLYAGRISPEKNVALLPQMLKVLAADRGNDFRLLIAGSGPNAEWLGEECEKQAKGKVRMLGHLNESGKLADIFANCDAFVHPNPREPFGITPLEAMASGLPVVAPNSGGLLSYANDENAWLAEPNPELFAAAVRDVFDDEVQRLAKVERALVTSANYTWQSSTDSQFDLYDRMYSEFSANIELFEYRESPKEFDFASMALKEVSSSRD